VSNRVYQIALQFLINEGEQMKVNNTVFKAIQGDYVEELTNKEIATYQEIATYNNLELMTVLMNRVLFGEEFVVDVLHEVAQRLINSDVVIREIRAMVEKVEGQYAVHAEDNDHEDEVA